MPKLTSHQADLVEATRLIFSGQSGAGSDLLDIAKTEILADILAQLERLCDILERRQRSMPGTSARERENLETTPRYGSKGVPRAPQP